MGIDYEVALAMLLLPLAAVGLTLMWQWHRLLPALVVVTLAIDHYACVSPEIANYSTFVAVSPDGLTLKSPVLAMPAPLVERVESEAAFTGFYHVAQVSWQRKSMSAPARA